jgi:hypothetical protein
MELPYRTYGINLSRKTNDNAALTVSLDADGNILFKDEYIKNILGKPEGITLKELYTRTKGVYSNSKGELLFKDSTLSRAYSLKEIVDSCSNWKDKLLTGALWWMGNAETDHSSCSNVPRKTEPNSQTLRLWSIDRFFYDRMKNNVYSKCNSDEIITGDLFVDKLNGDWIWYDIPGLEIVLPPIPDQYKISQIIAKLAFVTYDTPEPVAFRIWDSTNKVELARTAIVQCNTCEVSYPVTLTWQGQLQSEADLKCTLHETCGCVDASCVTGDSSCDTVDNSSNIVKRQYETGSRVIRIQFHVKNYQTDHWSRLFGIEIDGEYLTKSSIEAIIFDSNPQGKYGKKHGTVQFTKQSTTQVTFESPLETSNYAISLSCNKNINCWWENKSNTGFKIVSELPFTGYVDWSITNLNPSTSS